MVQKDIIREAVQQRIDWGKFESVVVDVLRCDDLPSIRKLGGGSDGGADAECWSFYENAAVLEQVIQITSEKTQKYKVQRTLKRLEESRPGAVSRLVVVFRAPVASSTRTAIQAEGTKAGTAIDVRDQEYLVSQLGTNAQQVFARHFLSTRDQVKRILDQPDPLGLLTTRAKRALLASIGAYVMQKEGRVVRGSLFEQTVLAVIVSDGPVSDTEALLAGVRELFPGEHVDVPRVDAALKALRRQRAVVTRDGGMIASQQALDAVGANMANCAMSCRAVLDECGARMGAIDDATRGYVERNVRRALLHVLRILGPHAPGTGDSEGLVSSAVTDESVSKELGRQLRPDRARLLIAVLGDVVLDPAFATHLATLGRTYAALMIRNMDPAGRAWQASTLRPRAQFT